MDDELESLLGVSSPPATVDPHPSMFRKPVGVTFLAQVVGKQPYQIEKRLAKCPVKEWDRRGAKSHPKYDFVEAMGYLIAPRIDIEDWLASKNAASLPPYINKMFWDSAMQRIRVMNAAGDLWHTEDVLVVLGRVALLIKEEAKNWIEDLPEKDQLTNQQYEFLLGAVDRLISSVRERLVELPKEGLTRASMSDTIIAELEASGEMPTQEVE